MLELAHENGPWQLTEKDFEPTDPNATSWQRRNAERLKAMCRHVSRGSAHKKPPRWTVQLMNDVIHVRAIQHLHDTRDIPRIVVRVADDSDPHEKRTRRLGRRVRPSRQKRASDLLEDVNRAGATETDDVRHTDLGALDLTLVGFSA